MKSQQRNKNDKGKKQMKILEPKKCIICLKKSMGGLSRMEMTREKANELKDRSKEIIQY